MRKLSALTLTLCLVAVVPCARTQRQDDSDKNAYYLFNGKTLEVAKDNPLMRNRCDGRFGCIERAFASRATRPFAILAMGLIEETSAGRVLKRLKAAQGSRKRIEVLRAGHMGRTTFLNSLARSP